MRLRSGFSADGDVRAQPVCGKASLLRRAICSVCQRSLSGESRQTSAAERSGPGTDSGQVCVSERSVSPLVLSYQAFEQN